MANAIAKKKGGRTTQTVKIPLPTLIEEKERLWHRVLKEEKRKRGGLQAWIDTVSWWEIDNSAGMGTSGMDKFGSIIDRMNMKL